MHADMIEMNNCKESSFFYYFIFMQAHIFLPLSYSEMVILLSLYGDER